MTYLLDETALLSLTEVQNAEFLAAPNRQDSNLSFGYTNANLWVKFQLSNQSHLENWLIEIGYPLLDEVELYLLESRQVIQRYVTGDRRPKSAKPIDHRNFLFPLNLKASQSITVLLKVNTTSSLRLPLTVWQHDAFFENDQYLLLTQGMYFGILLIMMLYNLFMFFSIKEKAYLHYVFYVASYIVVQASINGFWGQLFISEPNSLTDKWVIFGLSLVILSGCSFSLSFLNLKFYHLRFYKLLQVVGWLGGINFVAAFFIAYTIAIKIALFLAVFGSLSITVIGVYLWSHMKVREARYFSIAWVGFLLGSVLMMLSRMKLLPDNFFTENIAQIGSAFEVTLLSLALADKYNQLRGERQMIEDKARDSLSRINKLLVETLQKLEKSNAIKDDFLSTVSHELRTPMNGIIGSNELLKVSEIDSDNKEIVQISEKSANHMMALIDSILQFVDLQAGRSKVNKSKVDIALLFKHLEQNTGDLLKDRNLRLTFDFCSDLQAELYTDYDKLYSILYELVENAIKFTASGQVQVQAAKSERTSDEISFSVSDSGIGISSKDQASVFDAFFIVDSTNTRKQGGIGMGLTTAQSQANLLGTRIKVSSKYREGSCFKFSLKLQVS